jgi:hypothetical protein
MKIASSPLLKSTLAIAILLIISSIVFANDNGGKDKKSEKKNKEQVNKNTKEDIGQQVQMKYSGPVTPAYEESEEDMANWYISQSLPKPEKVSKKEENELEKINRKIIKKERKESKKLQKSIKKGEVQTKL